MHTGELRSQINAMWDAFWPGGISSPLEVMEQITCLLLIRRLDDAHSLAACRTYRSRAAKAPQRPIFHRFFAP